MCYGEIVYICSYENIYRIALSTMKSENVTKNGTKLNKKQNYICKDCTRQFIVTIL